MRTIFVVLLAFVLPVGAARADGLTVEAEGYAGGHFFSDVNHLGRGRYAGSESALDHSGLFGFRVGFVLIPRLSLEAELALVPTSTGSGASVLAFGYRAQAVVPILTGRVRPFVLVGGGGFTSSSSNPDLFRQDTRGEVHGGVGVKVDIGCHWGLRADGRVQLGQALQSFVTADWEITLALYGLFGRPVTERCTPPPKAAPPPPKPVSPPPPDS